ncbi:MAG: hypothetical protein ACUVR0_00430 [Candidatus Aminicenantales bacterium]
MKPREIVLLLLIIGGGIAITFFQSGRLGFLDFSGKDWFPKGEEFSFEEARTIEPPFPDWLTIDNPRGKVIIDKAKEDRIEITWEKKIWAEKEVEAKQLAEEVKLLITKSVSETKAIVLPPEKIRGSYQSNLRVRTPEALSVKVANRHGAVKVSGLHSVSVTNAHGPVILNEIKGDVYLRNRHGDVSVVEVAGKSDISVAYGNGELLRLQQEAIIGGRHANLDLEDIEGGLNLKAEYTSLSGRRIKGHLFVSTSYEPVDLKEVGEAEVVNRYGLVRVDGAKGPLSIENRYGTVAVSQLEGNLRITGKNIRIIGRWISGEVIYISSAYDNIELKEFAAKTEIFLRHGDCLLEPTTLQPGLSFQGDYASLRLLWPGEERLPTEIRVGQGKLIWRLSEPAATSKSNGEAVIRAFAPGKEPIRININNKFGPVFIERSVAQEKK